MTPTAGQVRRRLRRPPPPWRFRVARLYERLVSAAIVGAVGWGVAFKGLQKTGHEGASDWTALWLSVLAAVVLLKVLLAFGPVFAGRDRMFWVLSSPVDRTALLMPRFLGLLGFGAAVGAVWPAVVFGVVGSTAQPGPLVFAGAAMAGLGVVAGAVVLQRGRVRPQGWLSVLAGVAVIALLPQPSELLVFDAVWLVPVSVVLALIAGLSLRRLNRADLAAGASLAAVVRVSVAWLDLALLGAILAERRARLLGRVRSARLRGSRLTVLVWTDVLRARRAPNALLVWAGLLPLPALVALGGEVDWVPAVHLLAAFVATDRLAAGLKVVCRSAAIRRMLGVPDGFLRLAHLVVPVVGAVVWCVATVPFTPHVSWLNGAVSAAGAVAVVYRIATRPPLDYGVAAIDFGVLGPVPIGLVLQLGRGPVLLYLLCVLQVMLG
ncbi:DUF6297 family protein [Lentzea kentuckyensis]|uniref:DUF6297 family protein n=1 Tax=Lentzea kentuckyensis TaxID=360086 RepID=UPI000A385AF9|nr:DUF6297 family protein [Lentzea kentuckyensis]